VDDSIDRLAVTARAQDAHFWFVGFRRFLQDRLTRVAALRTDLRILDCGCGTGANLDVLGRFGRVYAFDVSDVGLRYARRAGRPLVRADITRIPFADAAFDMVVSFDVFQMLPDDRRALAEMARVLRPGGTLLLSAVALEALRGDHSDVWEEVRRYTPEMARRLVTGAGLAVLNVSFLFATLAPLIYLARAAQRRFPPAGTPRANADMRVPRRPLNRMLTWTLLAEAALARHVPMPFGSSLLVTARKPRI
jgi:SAM-dependent methyltransferase